MSVYAKKRGAILNFTIGTHTDVATGRSKPIYRVAHNRPNPVLEARHRCVREALLGRGGGGTDWRTWRATFAAAARACAERNPGRGPRRAGLPAPV